MWASSSVPRSGAWVDLLRLLEHERKHPSEDCFSLCRQGRPMGEFRRTHFAGLACLEEMICISESCCPPVISSNTGRCFVPSVTSPSLTVNCCRSAFWPPVRCHSGSYPGHSAFLHCLFSHWQSPSHPHRSCPACHPHSTNHLRWVSRLSSTVID
jgi:hypothetical protein